MTEIGVQFSINDAPLHVSNKTNGSRRRKNPVIKTQNNLFNQSQRNHLMQYSAVLPIISFSSFTDFKQKFIRISSNQKSIKQTTTHAQPLTTEFRLKAPSLDMSQTKTRSILSNRSIPTNIPKSSLSYPTIINRSPSAHHSNHHHHQNLPSDRLLYVVNAPLSPRRSTSARLNHHQFTPLPLHQQPHLLAAPLPPRPHPQYGHFLAYLRRQSLARIRRKQQEQEVAAQNDTIEATITFHSNRPSPPLMFHSTSNLSLGSVSPETCSMPTISLQTKRVTRPLSSYRQIQVQRSTTSIPTNYRLNSNQTPTLRQPPSSPRVATPTKKPIEQFGFLVNPTALMTPTNSVVDETIDSQRKKTPYELQLSGDMLNYCYVSDSGVKYQGQLLSTSV